MQVSNIAIRPSQASVDAGDIALTPELLAACGARHSRNPEGLESILKVSEGLGDEEAVETIFKFVDYGHASIADMVPVAINIEGVSLWMAYHLWAQCPLAGGQETSTRYCDMEFHASPEEAVLWIGNPNDWQVADALDLEVTQGHADFLAEAYRHYREALQFWQNYAANIYDAVNVPERASEKAKARIVRNFAFDRARYYLPIAAKTNLILIQSARAWITLIRLLLSDLNFESVALGKQLVRELEKTAPHLTKHACYSQSHWDLQRKQSFDLRDDALTVYGTGLKPYLTPEQGIWLPGQNWFSTGEATADLKHRTSRYDPCGVHIAHQPVQYDIGGVAFAEVRDMNRHRPGSKHLHPVPLGFYAPEVDEYKDIITDLSLSEQAGIGVRLDFAHKANTVMLERMRKGHPDANLWGLLGTQMEFCHTNTLDKAIYEFELRTGEGTHFRYRKHYQEWLRLLYIEAPVLKGLILEGNQ